MNLNFIDLSSLNAQQNPRFEKIKALKAKSKVRNWCLEI